MAVQAIAQVERQRVNAIIRAITDFIFIDIVFSFLSKRYMVLFG